jgi:hypothetical protein
MFRRPNKNSPVQQQMLKMLPSWPNVFSTPVKHSAVNSPKFLSRNCWNVVADVVSQLFQSVGICFIHFILQSKNYTCLINLLFLTILWPFIQTFSKHVSWVSHLKDLLGEISSLTPISPNFLSVSTVYFLSGFLSSNYPVVFSILTKWCILCLLGTCSPENWHQNFLRYFPVDSHFKQNCIEHIGYWIVYLPQAMVLQHWMAGWEMHHQKKTNAVIHCRSVLSHTAKGTLVWHFGPCLLPTRLICMCRARKIHPVFKYSDKRWDTEITNERLIDAWERTPMSLLKTRGMLVLVAFRAT